MATLTIDEVGTFRCKFHSIKPCANADYCMVAVYFEGLIENQVKDWNTLGRPVYLLHNSEDVDKFASMQPGHVYALKMAVGFQRENESNGKTYPAGVRYRILEVLKEIG